VRGLAHIEERIMLSPEVRERIAFRESGRALPGMLTPVADPVRTPGSSPGDRCSASPTKYPQTDQYGYSAAYLRGRITGALDGRAAEEVVYGDVTTAAENDLEHVGDMTR
jgi:cell division protease FtsH